jgi:hypothetical protein
MEIASLLAEMEADTHVFTLTPQPSAQQFCIEAYETPIIHMNRHIKDAPSRNEKQQKLTIKMSNHQT